MFKRSKAELTTLRKVLAGCALLLAACDRATSAGGVDATPSAHVTNNQAHHPIELFSWWARIGNWDALGAIQTVHRQHFPDDEILNASAEASGLARRTLAERMLSGEPPDTFQANIGIDLMRWVIVNGIDSRETKLTALDDALAGTAEWRKVMPPAVLKDLSYDGKLYAVPSNIHRLNSVFYNKKVLADHGIAEPASVRDLIVAGKKLRAAGIDLFAVGSRDPWTLSLFIFENLLIAREGSAFYQDYFGGRLEPDDPRLVRTLDQALELLQFANRDQRSLTWLQAMDLVVRGRAAMTVMGDWARISLDASGAIMGKDYGEIAFPGSSEAFVYTSDTFSLPIRAKNSAGAKRLLSTIASREGQEAVSAKNALPARLDLPPPEDAVLLEKFKLLRAGSLVLALSGLVPARFAEDLNAALPEMLEQQDIEPVIQTLRARYALLK